MLGSILVNASRMKQQKTLWNLNNIFYPACLRSSFLSVLLFTLNVQKLILACFWWERAVNSISNFAHPFLISLVQFSNKKTDVVNLICFITYLVILNYILTSWMINWWDWVLIIFRWRMLSFVLTDTCITGESSLSPRVLIIGLLSVNLFSFVLGHIIFQELGLYSEAMDGPSGISTESSRCSLSSCNM